MDADKHSIPQPDVQDKFVIPETMPEEQNKYDFAKTSMSSYFKPATLDNDDNTLSVEAGYEKPLPTNKSIPTPPSYPVVYPRTPSSDYKAKLDNYRKVNGYGEYAVSTASKRSNAGESRYHVENYRLRCWILYCAIYFKSNFYPGCLIIKDHIQY